jgi:hypothetical protein
MAKGKRTKRYSKAEHEARLRKALERAETQQRQYWADRKAGIR